MLCMNLYWDLVCMAKVPSGRTGRPDAECCYCIDHRLKLDEIYTKDFVELLFP